MPVIGATRSEALEDFIQAVQSQLDTAQARMTLKAENDKLPLTFAIRDISMDLKAHVEMSAGEIRIRPAGPAEANASTIHMQFTAITKPMIDENAVQLAVEDSNDVSLEDMGDQLDVEDRRRLEGIGVRTVSQLQDMQRRGLGRSVGRITNLPLGKLESVLSHATRPMVDDIQTESDTVGDNGSGDANGLRHRLRVRGRNLLRDGMPPTIGIGGRPVNIVRATDSEIMLAPDFEQMAGQMSLAHDNLASTQIWFDESSKVTLPNGSGGLQ